MTKNPPLESNHFYKPTRVPASEVGLSLTISDEALNEFELDQEKIIKSLEKDRKLLWD